MSCRCKELERQHGEGNCKCVHYREQFPHGECEMCSVSDHSPGPVEDDEILIRTLYSPVQINKETGVVNPVNIRQDALKRGLSVNRKRHTSEAELKARVEKKIADDMRAGKQTDGYYKVVTARCGNIRALLGEDKQRQFYVYDTALEADKSHADVCQAVDPPPKTANRKSIRDAIGSRLYELFAAPATDLAAVFAED